MNNIQTNKKRQSIYYISKYIFFFLIFAFGCGYHKINSDPYKDKANLFKKRITIKIDKFVNKSHKFGLEEIFLKALENRILISSSWKLANKDHESNLLLQATIDKCQITPLDFVTNNDFNYRSGLVASNASRLEIAITASMRLLDGATGSILFDKTELTFLRQYRVDIGTVGSYIQELNLSDSVLDAMANDFAESFLTQLFEGIH